MPKRGGASRDYPRSARLSELMREIAADTLVPGDSAWTGALDFERWLEQSEFKAGYEQAHEIH